MNKTIIILLMMIAVLVSSVYATERNHWLVDDNNDDSIGTVDFTVEGDLIHVTSQLANLINASGLYTGDDALLNSDADAFSNGLLNRTWAFWFQRDSDVTSRIILSMGTAISADNAVSFLAPTSGVGFSIDCIDCYCDISDSTVARNAYYSYVVDYNSNNTWSLWRNGTYVGSCIGIDTLKMIGTPSWFNWGKRWDITNQLDGDAKLDDMRYMENFTGDIQNYVDCVYASGDGTQEDCPEAAPPPSSTVAPTIVAPSPIDNANNNTNVTLNVTHSTTQNDVSYYLYFGDSTPLSETDLVLDDATRTGALVTGEYKNFTTGVGDGIYYYKWKVRNTTNNNFSINTTLRTWTLDSATPTITRLASNNWKIDNSTIISSYIYNLTLNISFFDINLEGGQTLINITNESGASAYQKLNVSITGTTVNISEIIDIGGWSVGNYIIKLIATDSHTIGSIPIYDVKKGLNYLRYTTEEGNTINIKSDTFPLTFKTTKLIDRYTFEFNYLFQKDTYKFIIESYNKINYLPNSEYPAHFIIFSKDGKGNWLDFGGISKKDIIVTKIDDYTYEIEITANGIKNFKFNSLGGLNKVEEHYKFRIGAVLDVWVYDEENYPKQINATVTSGVQSNTSITNISGARLVNITKDITSLNLTSSGFGTEIEIISITNNYHNFSFNMTPVSATKLYFYDEKSEALIEDETFSVYLETIGFSSIYSAITNPYTITGLPIGLYKLKASSTNYPERQYLDLDVSNITTTNLNIYLINYTSSAEKTFYARGSSLNALEDVYINFTRVINGTRITIAEESTDYDGAATLYLDENYEYVITFSKSGYDTKTISLEPINDEYIITMSLSIAKYNVSVYEGLRYSFSPSNTILNNNTKYNFTFTLNSSIWIVTNCTLRLKNGTTVLSETSSNTANSCFLRIEYNTGTMTNITSEVRYELESLHNFTLTRQYRIIYTYEGEFSLKNFLDDLSDFSMAGFDSFGRMMMAFIVIFVILILAGREIGFENKDILIIMFIALVGFFSFINWFYLDWDGMPEILGLKKYFIFYLMILIGFGYMFNKMKK